MSIWDIFCSDSRFKEVEVEDQIEDGMGHDQARILSIHTNTNLKQLIAPCLELRRDQCC